MRGSVEDLVAGGQFDDPAKVHHGNPVADVFNHREIMGNEQQGNACLIAQVLQQVDDLRLHRNVERGNRFIAHDHVRLQRDCAGDADPLALSTGELVRIFPAGFRVESDPLHEGGYPAFDFTAPRTGVNAVRGGENVGNPVARVQGRKRILENDLHSRAQPAKIRPGQFRDVLAEKPDRA